MQQSIINILCVCSCPWSWEPVNSEYLYLVCGTFICYHSHSSTWHLMLSVYYTSVHYIYSLYPPSWMICVPTYHILWYIFTYLQCILPIIIIGIWVSICIIHNIMSYTCNTHSIWCISHVFCYMVTIILNGNAYLLVYMCLNTL